MSRKDLTGSAAGRDPNAPLLDVRDIKTHFRTERGTVRAVDGVSFTLQRGRTLGVVGDQRGFCAGETVGLRARPI